MSAHQQGEAAHRERLERLAAVAVRVGLGLRPGQELVMTAPLESVALARAITAEHGTLLVIDEVQHLIGRGGASAAEAEAQAEAVVE